MRPIVQVIIIIHGIQRKQFTWRLSTGARRIGFYIRLGYNANACRVQDALRLFKTTPVFIKLVKTSIILSSPLSPSSSLSPGVCAIKFCNGRYSLVTAPFAYATTHSHEHWKIRIYDVYDVMPMAAFTVWSLCTPASSLNIQFAELLYTRTHTLYEAMHAANV